MPQEQHVVRCYACKKFQVQIVKKVPKWQCKVCTAKQSLLKVYAQGSGKECRQHVQNLNLQQGLMSEEVPQTPDYESTPAHFEDQHFAENSTVTKKGSKWSEYLDDNGPTQGSLNSWEEGESSPNMPSAITSMGRKRKLSDQDDHEDYLTYEESWQPEAEVLDLSSGPCASDILKNLTGAPKTSKDPVLAQPEFSGFASSKSKWSQFVSPKEAAPGVSGGENAGTLWNKPTKDKFNATATTFKASLVPLANSNSHPVAKILSVAKPNILERQLNNSTSFGYDFTTSKSEEKLCSSSKVKNPFCTVNDEDNLDSLLEF